jgi:hypothetical protein
LPGWIEPLQLAKYRCIRLNGLVADAAQKLPVSESEFEVHAGADRALGELDTVICRNCGLGRYSSRSIEAVTRRRVAGGIAEPVKALA